MIEIPSPTQTYDGRTLPPASEWKGSTLVWPLRPDWRIRADVSAALYGDAAIEVVTLTRQLWRSAWADAEWLLWTTRDNKPCSIENLCDECHGRGWDSDLLDNQQSVCGYCEGRGWFYDD